MGSFRPRTLTDLFDILRRRAMLIAFVTIIVLMAAFAVVINVPHLYESRTRIVVSGQIYDRQSEKQRRGQVPRLLPADPHFDCLPREQ